ncbi:MAG TPA: hypothetical protein DCR55_07685 [Lentisphaeria bacterium]|jgi:MFS family permease|nr:hypothetical protein [Lentisphaeria bacterium]
MTAQGDKEARFDLGPMKGELARSMLLSPVIASLHPTGVVMIVAIQHFEATATAKWLLTVSVALGMILAPLTTLLVSRAQVPITRVLAFTAALSAGGLILAGSSTGLWPFVGGILIGGPLLGTSLPLIPALWRQNVGAKKRGRTFSLVAMSAAVSALVGGLIISQYMGDDAGRFRPVLFGLAILCLIGGAAIWRVPSVALDATASVNPLRCLRFLVQDRLFGYVSLVWYIMGIANLATIPLRTELAASPDYLNLDAAYAVFLLMVLPEAVSVGAMYVWGRMFDRVNFFALRIAINCAFILSLLTYFTGTVSGIILGTVCFGIGRGGGTVAWTLWVTKFAKEEHTAEYMAVHTFLTATRAMIGPYLAYLMLTHEWLPINQIGWLAAALMTGASLMLVPVLKYGRR